MESTILPRRVLSIPQHKTATNPFSVLQWNILADGLAQYGEFTKADEQELLWETRAPLILAELQQADADVICMQEVNHFGVLLLFLCVCMCPVPVYPCCVYMQHTISFCAHMYTHGVKPPIPTR